MTLHLSNPTRTISQVYTDRALRAEAAENAAVLAIYSHPNPEQLACKLLAKLLNNEPRAMVQAFAEYEAAYARGDYEAAFGAADDMAKRAGEILREVEGMRK